MTKSEALQKLTAWLLSQVGYKASNKHNKYAQNLDSYGCFYNGKKDGWDWCDCFADDAYVENFGFEVGRKMIYQPLYSCGAGCGWSARYYKEHDAYYTTPQVGDQIFYGENGGDHTGIVIKVGEKLIETVEGNVSDQVVQRTVDRNDKWIDGFGRPDWSLVVDVKELAPADYSTHPEKLWNTFCDWLGNEYGAAGLLGNLDAESALVAANLQNTYQYKLDMSDKEYTEAVDDGRYKDFVDDGAGYGLAQWTHWSRKEKLLAKAKECSASIGNEDMQVVYLKAEIASSFPDVYRTLKNADSIAEASDCVLLDYERPADQSDANKQRRRDRCQYYYDKYHEEPKPEPGEYCEVLMKVISNGDRGSEVETLQAVLIRKFEYDLDYCGGVDGIFGDGTEYVVRHFQQSMNLDVDGVVGEQTWTALLCD